MILHAPPPVSSREALEDDCAPPAAAIADGCGAHARVALLEGGEEGAHDARARAADGVPQRYCAAIYIDALKVNIQELCVGKGDDCRGGDGGVTG